MSIVSNTRSSVVSRSRNVTGGGSEASDASVNRGSPWSVEAWGLVPSAGQDPSVSVMIRNSSICDGDESEENNEVLHFELLKEALFWAVEKSILRKDQKIEE